MGLEPERDDHDVLICIEQKVIELRKQFDSLVKRLWTIGLVLFTANIGLVIELLLRWRQ
jgi:hypothetical protein